PLDVKLGPNFQLEDDGDSPGDSLLAAMFGSRYRLVPRAGGRFTPYDRRMIRAIGAVLSLRYYHLFQVAHPSRMELFRGGSEDHYAAAFIEPPAYAPSAPQASRIASTIMTLRTAALSTYENRRVSTGALLLGPGGDADRFTPPTSPDALFYGVE